MQSEFLKFIDHHNLFAKEDKVLLAVSGGIDSVVLAHLFHQTKRKFGIAHCNFQLRGKESDSEEEFVKALAEKMDVSFHCKRFDTMQVVLTQGISTQMAARNLRYNWFNELLVEKSYDYLATAHHLNDSLETILFNLTKGTGIAGLRGIRVKNGKVIRPLLFAQRESIYQYAKENSLTWKEDSSNLSDKYHRNLIRNKVIPILKEINPGLENTIDQTIAKVQSTEEILKDAVRRFKKESVRKKENDIWIDLENLHKQAGKEILLYEVIKEFGFNYFQVQEILSIPQESSGNLFYAGNFSLNVDRNHLILSPKESERKEISFTLNQKKVAAHDFDLELKISPIEDFTLDKSPDIAQLDLSSIKNDFTLRLWNAGDRFFPLGMRHQKKLSDFMIDEKIPVNLKARTYVLVSGGDIIWVVGHRIDDRFKITKSTKSVLTVKKISHS